MSIVVHLYDLLALRALPFPLVFVVIIVQYALKTLPPPPLLPMDPPPFRTKKHGPHGQGTPPPLERRIPPTHQNFFTKSRTYCLFFLHSFFGLQWHVMGTQHFCVGAEVRFEVCRWCDG